MPRNRKITPESYRSTVLGYLCTVSKKKSMPIKELPLPMLSRLGVRIEHLGDRCSRPEIDVPADPDCEESRSMLGKLKRFMARNRELAPEGPGPGAKKRRWRRRERKDETEVKAPTGESVVSVDVLPKAEVGA